MDKIQRGIAAKHLLDNELLKEILNELDGTYHAAWRNAKTVEAREDCHRFVKLLERLTANIRTIAITGKLAEEDLKLAEGNVIRPALNEWAHERALNV